MTPYRGSVLAIAIAWPAPMLSSMWFSLPQTLIDRLYVFTFTLAGSPREIAFPGVGDVRVEHASQSNDDWVSATGFFAGLALALVAGAFRLGERLQRETDGLV